MNHKPVAKIINTILAITSAAVISAAACGPKDLPLERRLTQTQTPVAQRTIDQRTIELASIPAAAIPLNPPTPTPPPTYTPQPTPAPTYTPAPTPTNTPTPPPPPTPTPLPTSTSTPTPVPPPTFTPTPFPTPAPTPTATATSLPTPTLKPSPITTPTPSPTPAPSIDLILDQVTVYSATNPPTVPVGQPWTVQYKFSVTGNSPRISPRELQENPLFVTMRLYLSDKFESAVAAVVIKPVIESSRYATGTITMPAIKTTGIKTLTVELNPVTPDLNPVTPDGERLPESNYKNNVQKIPVSFVSGTFMPQPYSPGGGGTGGSSGTTQPPSSPPSSPSVPPPSQPSAPSREGSGPSL